MATERNWRTVALVEVGAMTALLLSYIWGWKGTFAGASRLIFVLYFGLGLTSHLLRRETARQIGFRLDNVPRALRNAAVVIVPAAVVVLTIGLVLGSWHFYSWQQMVKGAPWGLVWATAQQYGLLCFFYRRFLEIVGSASAATAAASVTFAMFHLPNPFLVAVTLAAGVVACTLYRREPNVPIIGLAHAMISFVILCSLPFSVTYGLRVGPGYLALP